MKTKAEELLAKQCNHYANGKCLTMYCLQRGGWKRGDEVDAEKSMCEYREAIVELQKLSCHSYQDMYDGCYGNM